MGGLAALRSPQQHYLLLQEKSHLWTVSLSSSRSGDEVRAQLALAQGSNSAAFAAPSAASVSGRASHQREGSGQSTTAEPESSRACCWVQLLLWLLQYFRVEQPPKA